MSNPDHPQNVQKKEFSYRRQILEYHLDTYGHVNNAVYLNLYEEARWDFITRNGYGHREVMAWQIGPVILECQVKFRAELVNREWITITSFCELARHPRLMNIYQKIWKEDQTLASEAHFTSGLMDLKLRKLIRATPEWLHATGLTIN